MKLCIIDMFLLMPPSLQHVNMINKVTVSYIFFLKIVKSQGIDLVWGVPFSPTFYYKMSCKKTQLMSINKSVKHDGMLLVLLELFEDGFVLGLAVEPQQERNS